MASTECELKMGVSGLSPSGVQGQLEPIWSGDQPPDAEGFLLVEDP